MDNEFRFDRLHCSIHFSKVGNIKIEQIRIALSMGHSGYGMRPGEHFENGLSQEATGTGEYNLHCQYTFSAVC